MKTLAATMAQVKRRKYAKRWLVALLALAASCIVPVSISAADEVTLEGNAGAANVTVGDKQYASSVNAKYNEVVKVQVYYHNKEDVASNKAGQHVRMKIAIPEAAGKSQDVKATVGGDNTNALEEKASINLERDDASLQYIPGSAVWKHNAGSNDRPDYKEEKISDEVVSGDQGMDLGEVNPGNFSATVTILARVLTPGVKVGNQVELKGESSKWAAKNTAKPGDTLKYLISYQNTGNVTQNKVVVRDNLPAHVSLVSGTTKLVNANNPDGQMVSDDITKGGINIGNYGAGANAYVMFEAKIEAADSLLCDNNELRNSSGVQPENVSEVFGTSVTTVNRDCSAQQTPPAPAPNPTPPPSNPPTTPPPSTPAYSCDMLTVAKGDGRKVTAKIDYTAKNGAKLKTVTYNFGDSTTPLTTDKTQVDHTYAKDGDYKVTVSLLMTVNGKDQTTTSEACAKTVTIGTSTPGSGLPNTGPGDVVAIFVTATAVGTGFHYLYSKRRLSN